MLGWLHNHQYHDLLRLINEQTERIISLNNRLIEVEKQINDEKILRTLRLARPIGLIDPESRIKRKKPSRKKRWR